MEILSANSSDYNAIKALLAASKLPFEDIGTEKQYFIIAKENNKLIGCIAIERYGNRAILRSMAVDELFRGQGISKELYKALLDYCIAQNIIELMLLTTTAKAYFEKAGWQLTHRDSVHADVKQSAEFTHLCPASATVMQLSLLPNVAEHLFKSGFNCAQSAFVPFALQWALKTH
jgi:amino-acid N-acetyltransferase